MQYLPNAYLEKFCCLPEKNIVQIALDEALSFLHRQRQPARE